MFICPSMKNIEKINRLRLQKKYIINKNTANTNVFKIILLIMIKINIII